MSIQNPLENYGLERIRMEEDDRYVWVYYAAKVENVVTKLTNENEELKAKNQRLKKCEIWVKQHFYCEEVIACESAKNRKLKRALYKACANWADCKACILEYVGVKLHAKKWKRMFNKCRAKAEQYK